MSRIYFVSDGYAVKIGFSAVITERMKALRSGSPRPLFLLTSIEGGEAEEAAMHAWFAHLRLHGEWFRAAPELVDFADALETGRAVPTGHAARIQHVAGDLRAWIRRQTNGEVKSWATGLLTYLDRLKDMPESGDLRFSAMAHTRHLAELARS